MKKLFGFIAAVFLAAGIFCLFIAWPVLLGIMGRLPVVSSIAEGEVFYAKPHFYDRYVKLQGNQLYPLDYIIKTTATKNGTEKQQKETSFFAYAVLEDGLLLIKLPISQWGKPFDMSFQGNLRGHASSSYSNRPDYLLARNVSKDLGLSEREVRDKLIAAFYLDTTVMSFGKIMLVVGIVLLSLSMAGIWWLFCIISKAKKMTRHRNRSEKQFIEKYRVAPEKRVYMAISAIYKNLPSKTVECLKPFWVQEEFEINRVSIMFRNDWSIIDHTTALDSLDWLLHSGHRTVTGFLYEFKKYKSDISDLNRAPKSIKEFYSCISTLRTFRGNTHSNSKLIDERYLQECKSISAWDYVRGVNVATVCYALGYITEEETWEYMEAFGEQIRQEFTTWEELAVSFLVGRFLWSRNANQSEFVVQMNYLFSYYKQSDISDKKYNLWQKYSLSDLPTNRINT